MSRMRDPTAIPIGEVDHARPAATASAEDELATAIAASARRKMLVMEASVAHLRAVVIGLNIAAYFAFFGIHAARAPLAFAIIGVAGAYALWSVLTRPYERYPLLRFGLLTLSCDALLIAAWIAATGGPHSEFWVVYIASVVSVAMRYDFTRTILVAFAEAGLYAITVSVDGGLHGIAMVTRPAYIVIAGLAAAYLTRQEQVTREELVKVERLELEWNTQLDRERDKVRHLQEIDRMKTDFVAHASHELRTPLTTLSGLATTLFVYRAKMTDHQVEEALLSMRRQGERVKMLIDNLLDLSQLDHGDLQLNLAPIELRTAVGAALTSAPPPSDRSIVLDIDHPTRAVADALRLEQILVNLFVNAYRYGGPTIACEAHAEGDAVVLHVHDDGPGVPAETVPHLFEPFRRGANAGGVAGSGLGLLISKRLAEAFGGELSYSADGGGALFALRLPRAS